MRILLLLTMLCFASLLCIAEERAEMPNLRDPEVFKKIISEAVELESLKKADGSDQFFKINEPLPFDGSGWGVTYWEKDKIQGL